MVMQEMGTEAAATREVQSPMQRCAPQRASFCGRNSRLLLRAMIIRTAITITTATTGIILIIRIGMMTIYMYIDIHSYISSISLNTSIRLSKRHSHTHRDSRTNSADRGQSSIGNFSISQP